MTSQNQQTSAGDLSGGEHTPQDSEMHEREQKGRATRRRLNLTEFTTLTLILESIVLALIIDLLPETWKKETFNQLPLVVGLLLVILSLLLLVRLSHADIPVTEWESRERRAIPVSFFAIGISLLAFWLGTQIQIKKEKIPEENPHPVISFAILEPRELDAEDEFKAVSGTLQLKSNIPTSSLDIKIYIKSGTETQWQLSDLKCLATIRNHAWRIEPDCIRFDPAYESFTVVAVLVDANHIYELPGSVAPHHVEAAEFADLKNKVLQVVYGEDESSISQPIEISRIGVGTVLPPTPSPTSTPISTDTPTLTPTREQTATPTFESTVEPTAKPTTEFTPTSIPTPIPLLPAVVIDDQETQQERRADGKDHYRLLRWKPWSGEAPDGWYYVIRFLPGEDVNAVFFAEIVPADAAVTGQGANEGWLTYSFDIYHLPANDPRSCYPYWDVIVGIDAERVNCLPKERDSEGICRLTEFSEIQQYLATAPPGTCPSGSHSGSRSGSTQDPGHQNTHQ
jgi:hypothetical protein